MPVLGIFSRWKGSSDAPTTPGPSIISRIFSKTGRVASAPFQWAGDTAGGVLGGLVRPLVVPIILIILLVVALTIFLGRAERVAGSLGA